MATPRERFQKEYSAATPPPPPEFPDVFPAEFIQRYEPDIQDQLRKANAACKEWVRKYVTGQGL